MLHRGRLRSPDTAPHEAGATRATGTDEAPSSATSGTARRMLSPMRRLTMLGAMRPRKGSAPTTTSMMPVTTAMIATPIAMTPRVSSPRPRAASSPSPSSVKRSATIQAMRAAAAAR
jgi:hypothetical protein